MFSNYFDSFWLFFISVFSGHILKKKYNGIFQLDFKAANYVENLIKKKKQMLTHFIS